MPTTPLAGVPDLRVRLMDAEVEDVVLEAVLRDISDLARAEAGTAGAAWDAEALPPTVPPHVTVVVLAAARRRVLNPDAYSAERVGDYSYQRSGGADGDEFFTPAELDVLRGFRKSGGLGSLRVVRPGLAEAEDQMTLLDVNGRLTPWPDY